MSCPPRAGLTPGVPLGPAPAQAVAALPGAVDEALGVLTFLLHSSIQNGLVLEINLKHGWKEGNRLQSLLCKTTSKKPPQKLPVSQIL